MRFDDKTICEAINCSWVFAQEVPASNINDSIRRWNSVADELTGMLEIINWASNTAEERKHADALIADIVFLRDIANYNAFGA